MHKVPTCTNLSLFLMQNTDSENKAKRQKLIDTEKPSQLSINSPTSEREIKKQELPPKAPKKSYTQTFTQFHSIEELFASFDKDPPPPPVSTHGIAFPPDYTPEKYRLIFSKSVSRPTPTYTSSDPEINS